MTNIFGINDTVALLQAMELTKDPATYLVDTFFPQKMPTSFSDTVAVEYRKGKRTLAPYIVKGSKGVNIARESAQAKFYKAPLMGPRRILSLDDIESRMFGETPIYSTVKPEERAAKLQAQDLVDLRKMIANRKNKMAADILQTGETVVKGYADDGKTFVQDIIKFDWEGNLTPATSWDDPTADIYTDIQAAVEKIAEDTGEFPTLMLCGKNVERYLLKNQEIFNWLMIPNRQNLAMMNFAPRYDSISSRYIGNISALGLEVRSYIETYTDDDGQVKPFIDDDTVIIANPGKGKQLSGRISLIDDVGVKSYVAEYVPFYATDKNAQQMSLTLFSRSLLVPDVIDDWISMSVKF